MATRAGGTPIALDGPELTTEEVHVIGIGLTLKSGLTGNVHHVSDLADQVIGLVRWNLVFR